MGKTIRRVSKQKSKYHVRSRKKQSTRKGKRSRLNKKTKKTKKRKTQSKRINVKKNKKTKKLKALRKLSIKKKQIILNGGKPRFHDLFTKYNLTKALNTYKTSLSLELQNKYFANLQSSKNHYILKFIRYGNIIKHTNKYGNYASSLIQRELHTQNEEEHNYWIVFINNCLNDSRNIASYNSINKGKTDLKYILFNKRNINTIFEDTPSPINTNNIFLITYNNYKSRSKTDDYKFLNLYKNIPAYEIGNARFNDNIKTYFLDLEREQSTNCKTIYSGQSHKQNERLNMLLEELRNNNTDTLLPTIDALKTHIQRIKDVNVVYSTILGTNQGNIIGGPDGGPIGGPNEVLYTEVDVGPSQQTSSAPNYIDAYITNIKQYKDKLKGYLKKIDDEIGVEAISITNYPDSITKFENGYKKNIEAQIKRDKLTLKQRKPFPTLYKNIETYENSIINIIQCITYLISRFTVIDRLV